MSLIQSALDKAHEKEPEAPIATIPLAEEPRMQNIQFYETAETKETPVRAFRPKKKNSAVAFKLPEIQISANMRLALTIGALVLLTIIGGRFFISTPEQTTQTQVAVSEVIVKTETPVTQRPTAQIRFTLTGITETDGMRLALINNQVVGEGDRMRENAVVKTISKDTVVLEYQNKPLKLSL